MLNALLTIFRAISEFVSWSLAIHANIKDNFSTFEDTTKGALADFGFNDKSVVHEDTLRRVLELVRLVHAPGDQRVRADPAGTATELL